MAKQVIGNLKLRIPGGKATAGPPVGSTLGQWGLNMMDFINPFNEKTKEFNGKNVIVHIKVYDDRTFDWTCLGQPVDDLIREKLKSKKALVSQTSKKLAPFLAPISKKSLRSKWTNLTLSTWMAPLKSSPVPPVLWVLSLKTS